MNRWHFNFAYAKWLVVMPTATFSVPFYGVLTIAFLTNMYMSEKKAHIPMYSIIIHSRSPGYGSTHHLKSFNCDIRCHYTIIEDGHCMSKNKSHCHHKTLNAIMNMKRFPFLRYSLKIISNISSQGENEPNNARNDSVGERIIYGYVSTSIKCESLCVQPYHKY
uniref:Uncharacterized protein n=1 Tax=Glossina brevipalpis TaxID=37001 RepID=A0A1A9W5G8_9MUSC